MFVNNNESWHLFRLKVFRREMFSRELEEIGKKIAKECRGLPLSIVVVAGMLADEEKRQDWWKQHKFANGCRSTTMDENIALSYNHLPHHLKPRFLFFAAFPEDFEIPVWKLTWLWITEGFIPKMGEKSLEDVVEEYLMDLIGRNLILVSKGSLTVESKPVESMLCCILCNRHLSYYNSSKHFLFNRHLSMNDIVIFCAVSYIIASAPNISSFLCFRSGCTQRYRDLVFPFFKPLKVLDISCIKILRYPYEIEQLVLLRYLALCFSRYSETCIPTSISSPCNLETLILHTCYLTLPLCIRKMIRLRQSPFY
ncbi:hypothetical protein HYC85_023555 [Camellia sinensis]|uniref:Disease resistance protein winged helix domain-containing protein n=1 Tax=Camellia sinensis TaxID=4442 RepID=A0A7J7GIS8_CAMSI|nr:hypothetical protein HYC85_023555 [Camellia sinensis]